MRLGKPNPMQSDEAVTSDGILPAVSERTFPRFNAEWSMYNTF